MNRQDKPVLHRFCKIPWWGLQGDAREEKAKGLLINNLRHLEGTKQLDTPPDVACEADVMVLFLGRLDEKRDPLKPKKGLYNSIAHRRLCTIYFVLTVIHIPVIVFFPRRPSLLHLFLNVTLEVLRQIVHDAGYMAMEAVSLKAQHS